MNNKQYVMLKKNKKSEMPIIMLVNKIKVQGLINSNLKKVFNNIILGNIVGCNC